MHDLFSPPGSSEVGTHRTRALVLGGGGSAGNAWLIGLAAGFSESGLDLTDVDMTVGTSAGSTAAAQLAGDDAAVLLGAILGATPPSPVVGDAPGPTGSGASGAMARLQRYRQLIAESSDHADLRRRVGQQALELARASDGSEQARWRAVVAGRFSEHCWPTRRIAITAVDAETGRAVVFDRDSGVDLVDAVAASCASATAYRIGDRSYIDGGYRRSSENADLAGGFEKVLVLSPLGGEVLVPREWRTDLATQVDELRARGAVVEVVVPDSNSRDAFGDNMMNPATRPPAARAGYNQGVALAERIHRFWKD